MFCLSFYFLSIPFAANNDFQKAKIGSVSAILSVACSVERELNRENEAKHDLSNNESISIGVASKRLDRSVENRVWNLLKSLMV